MLVYSKGGMAASYPFLPMSAVCLCIQRVAWLPATHSYQCLQYVCVFKGWYGCQLPTTTNVCRMSVYSKGGMAASYPLLPMCAECLCIQRVLCSPVFGFLTCARVHRCWCMQLPTRSGLYRCWCTRLPTRAVQVLMHATAHQIRAVQVLMHATAHQGCTGVDARDCPPGLYRCWCTQLPTKAVQVLMHATAHQGCTGVDARNCPPGLYRCWCMRLPISALQTPKD